MQKDIYVKKHELLNHVIGEKASRLYQLVIPLLLLVAMANTSFAQISGTVYRDFNEDGVRSYTANATGGPKGEIGVGNVIVNVYNAAGQVATAITSSATATAGTYTVTVSGTGPYRVEFVNLPAGNYDGSRGTGSGTSVQFVASSSASNVDLGINVPDDYCQANPKLVIPCYENGSGISNTNPVIVNLNYNDTGTGKNAYPTGATADVMGSIWGVAYDKKTKLTYVSTFLKRNTGLGPRGLDGIYVVDYSGATPVQVGGFDLQGVTPSNGGSPLDFGSVTRTLVPFASSGNNVNELSADRAKASRDDDAFGKVAKVGYGDIDIDQTTNTLWAVNLNERSLVAVDLSSPLQNTTNPNTVAPAKVRRYYINGTTAPFITGLPGCPSGTMRPFGLGIHKGIGYVGVICDGSSLTTVDMTAAQQAYVLSFNPTNPTAFTTVANVPLNYPREQGWVPFAPTTTFDALESDNWQRWVDTYTDPTSFGGTVNSTNQDFKTGINGTFVGAPQPVLADIDFLPNGDLVLGFMDRFAHQQGWRNYIPGSSLQLRDAVSQGDMLLASFNGSTYSFEGPNVNDNFTTPLVPASAQAGQRLNDGPSSAGEYFYGDYYIGSDATHPETALGGIAILPGSNEVTAISFDPADFNAMGVRWLYGAAGYQSRVYTIMVNTSIANFGKGSGLGDVELLCNPAPIQIGNRVFRDSNNNGIQDPGEPGLAGVQVLLQGPGSTAIATATTNANGEYYFSTAVGTSTTSSINNLTLTSGGSYTLSFPTSVSALAISTFPNSATGTNADAIDSDPTATGVIAFTLGLAGQNNFAYDAGYACVPLALSLTSATVCAGQPVSLSATSGFTSYTFSSGLAQVGTSNVALIASATGSNTYSVTALNADGCSGTASGTVTVNQLPVVTLSSAAICAGQSATLTATSGLSSYTFSPGLTRIGTTNLATGTAAGTYSVTAVSAAGCIGISSGIGLGTITVNPVPALSLSSATICAGQTATLTASGTGFTSYIFSPGLTQVGTGNTATGTTAGTYSVTATTSLGCSATATGSITVNPVPIVALSSMSVCADQVASLTATPGYASYVFSPGLAQVGNSNVATGTVDGAYSVTAISMEGCSATATGSITVNPVPVVTLSSATIYDSQVASLTATPGFTSYVFSPGLTQVGTSNVATGTVGGVYSVTAISSAGCTGVASATLTVEPIPVLVLTSATVCAGQTATLTATPGFDTYVFSSGLTQVGNSNVATGTVGNAYSVTATTSNGFSVTSTGSIVVNPLPVVTLVSATVCAGQVASLTATPGYASYVFSPGLAQVGTSNVATGTVDGAYSVTAISTEGCSATATGSITVNPVVALTLTSATVCAGQSATLTASLGFTNYVFSAGLTPVANQPNVAIGTVDGTYSVTAINSASCSGTAVGTIIVNPQPVVAISVSSATLCAGQSATLTASGGDTYLWSNNDKTASIIVTTGAVYSVTATTVNGCSGVASTTITVNPLPVLTVNSTTSCAGQSTTLTVGGCTGGTINWSTAEKTASIVVSPALTAVYSVTCTLTTGCSSIISTTVTVNLSPSYTSAPQAITATCTGAVASNDAQINLTTLQNTERADITLGSTYGSGPVYGAPTNLTVTAGAASFTNLPNPGASQPYTVRLYSAGGTCYTDVTVILEPTYCNCPAPKCVPLLIQKTRSSLRTASR